MTDLGRSRPGSSGSIPQISFKWRRWLGLAAVILSCLFFAVKGYDDQRTSLQSYDFRPVYAASRCFISHCNPYNSEETKAEFVRHGGVAPTKPEYFAKYFLGYPPSTLFLMVPIAALPWPVANLVWTGLICIVFTAATLAIADLCLPASPLISLFELAIFICTSLLLVMVAQPAAIAVGLCSLAVWCFFRQKYVSAGVVLFGISLTVKPQIGALVLVYFFLANASYRRIAFKVAACTVVLSLPGIVWASVMPQSAHWAADLHRNLVGISQRSMPSDPGPANTDAASLPNLQAVFSLVHDDPAFYNRMSWAVGGILLLAWAYVAVKLKDGIQKDYLCLASIAALSLLPIYHRNYDTRLLLLTFPALALMVSSSRLAAVSAAVVSLLMTMLTFRQIQNHHIFRVIGSHLPDRLFDMPQGVIFLRPSSFGCLLAGLFYLGCCYVLLSKQYRSAKARAI